jgi:hypothetical protein
VFCAHYALRACAPVIGARVAGGSLMALNRQPATGVLHRGGFQIGIWGLSCYVRKSHVSCDFASEPSSAPGESKLHRTLATALANHPPIFLDGRLRGSY